MAPEFFSHVLDVNLTGSFRCAEAMHPALKARGGVIVNIASMYARFGSPRNPAYGSSKAGVEQLTKSLAIAWAPDGIRVNAVAPGFIVTEQSARARQDPAFVAGVEARTPMGRWGQPGDIAGAVLFLASPASQFHDGLLPARGRRIFGCLNGRRDDGFRDNRRRRDRARASSDGNMHRR